ncbi:MAG TPA: RsmB/NOP family class I SAM-dependent RNA methyltransferase [Cellvibrio sp.]|nr:RsmB/NOP family class I SAM-dependent RNA methyltransferase [Cellvibrio sp.]
MSQAIPGFFSNDEFAQQLFSAWRELLSDKQLPALDRWLKGRNKIQHGKYVRKVDKSLQQQLGLSSALFAGVRYLQLACALEHAYQLSQANIDWQAWDGEWQFEQVKKIPVANFWFWVELRLKGAEQSLPRKLRDAQPRAEFFKQCAALLDQTEKTAEFLLWNGLRPSWYPLLQERATASNWSPEQLQTFIVQQNQSPPIWLRLQRDKPIRDAYNDLAHEGVNVSITERGDISAQGGRGVSSTKLFQQGFVEVQDLASQQIALAVNVKTGDKVWDCCAGAGGKTVAIASRMNNKGVVVATDLHGYKLEELKRRSKRADIHNVRAFTWEGAEPLRLPKEIAQQQGFDWVLVDAPCSSAGTWRRNQDARWRFSEKDTAELIALQRKILTNAAPAVRAKGSLVYATCSWQVSENEAQVKWFLDNHPEFSLQSQSLLGAPLQDSDTMFVAVLQRQ